MDTLRQRTVDAMRNARANESLVRSAITAYLRDGLPIESPEALTDYFCVDTPSILDDAGFDDAEGTEVATIFDEIATLAVREFRRDSQK
jgi:hypothetical protein